MCEPKEIHLVAVKHILRYLQGTLNFGLKYEKVGLDLHGLTDSDWGGSVKDRKSTSRCYFSLGSAMISWICRKQSLVDKVPQKSNTLQQRWPLEKQFGLESCLWDYLSKL